MSAPHPLSFHPPSPPSPRQQRTPCHSLTMPPVWPDLDPLTQTCLAHLVAELARRTEVVPSPGKEARDARR